ncbi:oxygenase MpaB family protein [Streptomyces sp. NPDC056480]|uniref:oxygenase MpaB family protein n=1 Tax=Streptomyces sp. NPDC056480 TaxID=3345833 RepID=UPI003678F6B0
MTDWDSEHLGLPVNRTDMATTFGLLNSTCLIGMRALGLQVGPAESRAVMHLWKYVGHLLGVDAEWLFDDERRTQNAFNCHLLPAQGKVSPAGAELSAALVDGRRRLEREQLTPVRAAVERAHLPGLLRFFPGRTDLGDLSLPVGVPWTVPLFQLRNLALSLEVARSPGGRARLERAGEQARQRRLGLLLDGAPQ